MCSGGRCEIVTLDKMLYQRAYRSYRQWNEAEAAGRARDAVMLPSIEAWRRYVALVEFCWRLSPQPSQHTNVTKSWRHWIATMRPYSDWRSGGGCVERQLEA